MSFNCKSLDEFLSTYGDLLGAKARQLLAPLHVPGRDATLVAEGLLRKPYEAQAHVITAGVKLLSRHKAWQCIAVMGTGKTLMAMAAAHSHAQLTRPARLVPSADARVLSFEAFDKVASCYQNHPQEFLGKEPPRVARAVLLDGKRHACKAVLRGPGRSVAWLWEMVPFKKYKGEVRQLGASFNQWRSYQGARVTYRGEHYVLANGREVATPAALGYRAVVVCPGQLVEKWKREIEATIPNADVRILESHSDVLALVEHRKQSAGRPPARPTWFVIGRDRCKLSCGWKPVYKRRSVPVRDEFGNQVATRWLGKEDADEKCSRCPGCGQVLKDKKGDPVAEKWLKGGRRKCVNAVWRNAWNASKGELEYKQVECGERLWQEVPKPRRYSPARLIQKRLKGYFDYLVVDEAHEYKGQDSIQADAIGGLASACKKVIALTGTLVGGYAWHVRTLLFRVGAGQTMIGDGFGWGDEKKWNEQYGRIETKITRSHEGEDDLAKGNGRAHQFGRGESKAKETDYVRPGIMPTMFKHLLWCSTFLDLEEVAADLPPFREDVVTVPLGPDLEVPYKMVDEALTDAVKEMVRTGNKRMLGTMLNCLLCYPDFPFDWKTIGYKDEDGNFFGVCNPPNLDPSAVYPKEAALVERCVAERNEGRQVWVYCTFTDKRDCIRRLERFLQQAGLRVKVMRSDTPPAEREAWINANGHRADVVISHPDLVKTGLDFFNWEAGHNFTTIMFYQTGYNLFTLRQASRRAWRIGQKRECRVYYFYYEQTMQERAMTLMGRKLSAAMALEGKFSSEGLAAMAGDDENLEMALAKSLADNIVEEQATRAWSKLTDNLVPTGGFRLTEADVEENDRLARELEELLGAAG
jgi:hypothetical protein